MHPPAATVVHPEDARRRRLGFAAVVTACGLGAVSLCVFFVLLPAAAGQLALLSAVCAGAAIALPAGSVYLTVPRLLDRHDPEPPEVLAGCVAFGALFCCGVAVAVNTLAEAVAESWVGAATAEHLAIVVVAPLVEEALKGAGVLGVFHFLRREFDGVVDGVIYACFIALGFAAIENVIYYARGAVEGPFQLTTVVLLRGVLSPWGHPVYTAMTGLGLGLSRETTNSVVRVAAPAVGYGVAVLLHATWNGGSLLASALGAEDGAMMFCLQLSLWFLFLAAFVALMVGLSRRRRRILEAHLADEVVLGFVLPHERDLVLDRRGLRRARDAWGPDGERLVRAVARLATAKWHAERARVSATATVSHELVVPLRQAIAAVRSGILAARARGR